MIKFEVPFPVQKSALDGARGVYTVLLGWNVVLLLDGLLAIHQGGNPSLGTQTWQFGSNGVLGLGISLNSTLGQVTEVLPHV